MVKLQRFLDYSRNCALSLVLEVNNMVNVVVSPTTPVLQEVVKLELLSRYHQDLFYLDED